MLFPWQFFYNVGAQDDEGEKEDIETTSTNNRNDNGDNNFTVIIPENAAWSQSTDQRFNPSNITIPVGAEVTWINEDKSEHTVTSGNVANEVHERIYDGRFYGILGSEDSFPHIFNEPGIYPYFCSPHPWMTGFVIVDGSIQDSDMQDDEEEDSTVDEEEQDEDDEDDEDDNE